MNLFYFIGGLLIGYGIRLIYHTVTGRDIPRYKPRDEVERLLVEAELIIQDQKGKV